MLEFMLSTRNDPSARLLGLALCVFMVDVVLRWTKAYRADCGT